MGRWELSLGIILLVLHVALAWTSAVQKGVTFDEPFHIGPAYLALSEGEFRFGYAQMLPDLWAAIPGAVTQDIDIASRRAEGANFRKALGQYESGDIYLFDSDDPMRYLLMQNRSMIILLSGLLGAGLWWAGRRWWGPAGGLLVLALYAMSPTVLAHARLVTGDLAATAFFMGAVGALWLVLHRLTWPRLAASVLLCLGLVLTKSSAVLIVPMSLLLVAARLGRGAPWPVQLKGLARRRLAGRWRLAGAATGLAAAHVLLGVLGIWAYYGFSFEAVPGAAPAIEARLTRERIGDLRYARPVIKSTMIFLHENRLLPEPFLMAYGHYLGAVSGRQAYMAGHYAVTGWWSYFPFAFAVKTSLGVMVVLLSGLAGWGGWLVRKRGFVRQLYRTWPLWVLILVYG
ncbi:MAG: hypothetical protein R3336_08570, partial [Phycisphaeraceae bacterium]|nr:hypothetical protein [Phycisphaeraceae bacterium]